MNKNKTFLFLTSIFLLFFICLFPIQINAAQVECACSGEITNISQSDCTALGFCTWESNKCDCETDVVIEDTVNCDGTTLLNEAGIQLPSGAQENFACAATVINDPVGGCACTGDISSAFIGSSTTCGNYPNTITGTTLSCTWQSTFCQCTTEYDTTKQECAPNATKLGQYHDEFCCQFDDGTQQGEQSDCSNADFSFASFTGTGTGTTGGTGTGTGTTGGTGTGTGTTGGTGTGTGSIQNAVKNQTQELPNFLGTSDVNEVIGRVVRAIIGISGSFALAIFIYGGALWMFSGGNPDRIRKGRSAMIYAAIGLVVVFLSYTLVAYVLRALK